MINILFFGQLRERVKVERLQIELTNLSQTVDTVATLRTFLQEKGPLWRENLAYGKALVAVNQNMAKEDSQIKDRDEVAFFPPVTGG